MGLVHFGLTNFTPFLTVARSPTAVENFVMEPFEQLPPPPAPTPVPPSVPTRRRWRLGLFLFVVAAVLGGFAGAQIATERDGGSNSPDVTIESNSNGDEPSAPTPDAQPSDQPVQTAPAGSDDERPLDVGAIVDRIGPSVVTVEATTDSQMGSGRSTGTGVVITSDGEILTNAHVVDGASKVSVLFADSIDPIPAVVLARDAGNDLALLKVDQTGLKAAVFADPASVNVGDEVVAVGFALALDGGPTVTRGIVSAINRTIANEDGALDGLIQTDAAISSGNSGGPLLNSRGEVVGINTAVFTSSMGTAANNVGFAISVGEALPIVEALREQAGGEERVEGYLGVGLEVRVDGGRGALIAEVAPDSPAARAGIEVGDVVVAADGTPIDGQPAFIAAIRDKSPGDSIDIEVLRDGSRLTLTATLIQRPQG